MIEMYNILHDIYNAAVSTVLSMSWFCYKEKYLKLVDFCINMFLLKGSEIFVITCHHIVNKLS